MGRRATPVSDPLARYNSKRDFAKTAEPAGALADSAGHLFMVQKHDATRLHWDFRLELDGVLKSWAVTRGPSPNPDDKRLAVRTEDHPLAYATFEGTIPKGEYGGGTVMLWDKGVWIPHPDKDPRKTIEEGHLHFTLEGERMKGEWLMIRLKPRGREKSENWLLRKIADDHAGGSGDLTDLALTSVETGRTMIEIAEGKGGKSKWHSDRAADDQPEVVATKPKSSSTKPSSRRKLGSRRAAAETDTADVARLNSGLRRNDEGKKAKQPPPFQPVQLATLADTVPTGSGWLHEVKYDGYRALVAFGGGQAKAYTRNELDWSDRFASVVEVAANLPGSGLIDGEIVVLDKDGHPSFQALQAGLKDGAAALTFFAFDLLNLDGADLTALPTVDRKGKLAALLKGAPDTLRYSEHVRGSGEKLFASLCAQGLEGVVSKKADAPYRGKRTQAWIKVKCLHRQEFVIVGWLPSDKGRGFRSLLLGLHEDGALRYAGKAGTGFSAALIDELLAKLAPLERKTATVDAPRAAVRGAHWVTPKLVAEIAFAEFTDEGVLRHSSFIGLREDKGADEVILESPVRPEPVEGPSFSSPPAKKKDSASTGSARTERVRPRQPDHGVTITNPARVIFPESGITKGDLATYYEALADPLLQWLGDRPVSLVRCPQGRAKACFFQKHDAGSFGDAVKHVPIREKDGHDEPYLYVDDIKGALTCVQMGAIEFHGWGSKVADVEKPDRLVFDLDPDEGLGFAEVRHAAVQLRDVLGEMGLASWPMLSGGKGVHVVVPLNPTKEWPEVKDFARRFALAISEAHPKRFTANMKKTERTGRIFLDWLRNQRGATAVLPYSARARPNAPVAVPIGWNELDGIDKGGHFTIRDAEELLKRAASKALKGWAIADQVLPEL